MPRETKRPTSTEPVELPELTPKQMGFVRAKLDGKSASEAVRAATDTSKWSDNAVWVEACKLSTHPKIRLWLQAATANNLETCKITLETHVAELARLSSLAEQAGAYGAAIKAEELKGRANGLYVERIKTDDGSELSVLQALAKLEPGLRAAIAQSLGLELPESDTLGADNTGSTPESTTTH